MAPHFFSFVTLFIVPSAAFLPLHYGRNSHPFVLQSIALADGAGALTDEVELTKLFGRMADKVLLLDVPGAGTVEMMNCCHGGCDNCDFARIFDEQRAAKPKWVAHYGFWKHPDGRSHRPPWATAIFGEGSSEKVNLDQFVERLQSMPYTMTMGPMKSVPTDEPPSKEAATEFFQLLANGATELSADVMGVRLTELTGKEHGCLWRDFKNVQAAR